MYARLKSRAGRKATTRDEDSSVERGCKWRRRIPASGIKGTGGKARKVLGRFTSALTCSLRMNPRPHSNQHKSCYAIRPPRLTPTTLPRVHGRLMPQTARECAPSPASKINEAVDFLNACGLIWTGSPPTPTPTRKTGITRNVPCQSFVRRSKTTLHT